MSEYLLESERTAMAILRSGRSFAEAAESTRVPVERVMALWNILFEVQTGNRSCRSAADVIMETINKENTMASEESKKKIDWDSMNELSKIYQEGAASYEKQCSEFWDKLSYDDQIAAFYSVVSLLSKGELIDKQSYRGILYDAFGFGPESYAIGMECGFMELHNAIYHKDELEAWAKRNGYVKEIKND